MSAIETAPKRTAHPVIKVSDLLPGQSRIVKAGRFEVGVYNLAGTIRAVLNICPHEGVAVCKGKVSGTFLPSEQGEYCHGKAGHVLACPWHGWEFDLMSGKALHDPNCSLKIFETQIVDGWINVLV